MMKLKARILLLSLGFVIILTVIFTGCGGGRRGKGGSGPPVAAPPPKGEVSSFDKAAKLSAVLRKDFGENMTIEEGIKFAMKIFKQILGKNFEISRFEAGYVTIKDSTLVRLQGDELKKYVK